MKIRIKVEHTGLVHSKWYWDKNCRVMGIINFSIFRLYIFQLERLYPKILLQVKHSLVFLYT